jgi:phosphatidylethanolamine-binding protein (PEBP) family uncharacterized protein
MALQNPEKKMKMRLLLISTLVAIGLVAPVAAKAMNVAVDWTGTAQCFDSESPVIKLSGVPKATKQLRFRMNDLDAPGFEHGGGTVAYAGQRQLAKAAFRYRGPCPPGPHRYQWHVEALDESGQVVDAAQTTTTFPPK